MGTFRFFLAMCVVFFHLTHQVTQHLGILAVNFFYVISGFLITMVLNDVYKFKLAPFAANRVLRLYPAYAVCVALTLCFHAAFAAHASFHFAWSGPRQPGDLLGNVLVFPWAFLGDGVVAVNFADVDALQADQPRYKLVPASWSVGVEVVCYAALWLCTARNFAAAALTLAAAVCWHLAVPLASLNPMLTYFPVPAALLPFSLGAIAYFLKDRSVLVAHARTGRGFVAVWLVVTVVAFVGNWRLSEQSSFLFFRSPWYYANTLIAFVSVWAVQTQRMQGVPAEVDRWLGDLSYPVFLTHWLGGYVAWLLFAGTQSYRGLIVFALGSAISLGISALIVSQVDRRLTYWRDAVRAGAVLPPADRPHRNPPYSQPNADPHD